MVIFFLKSYSPNVLISISSINILPLFASSILNNVRKIVDFPDPVLPTIPI